MPPVIHPFLVHFPIALLTLAFVFDLPWGDLAQRESRREWAWRSWVLGTAGAVISATFGIVEHFDYLDGPFTDAIESHQLWGLSATVFALAYVMWRGYERHQSRPDPGHRAFGLAVATLVIILLFLAASSGGTLVFDLGIAVKEPSK